MKYLAICLLLLLSCNESSTDEIAFLSDEFIIGLTFGECSGDCSHLYKLDNNDLFADMEEGHWSVKGLSRIKDSLPEFSAEPLDNEDAILRIMEIEAEIPDLLQENQEGIYGCPDCADGGAIHVIQVFDNKAKYWIVDNDIQANPDEIQPWAARVKTILEELSF